MADDTANDTQEDNSNGNLGVALAESREKLKASKEANASLQAELDALKNKPDTPVQAQGKPELVLTDDDAWDDDARNAKVAAHAAALEAYYQAQAVPAVKQDGSRLEKLENYVALQHENEIKAQYAMFADNASFGEGDQTYAQVANSLYIAACAQEPQTPLDEICAKVNKTVSQLKVTASNEGNLEPLVRFMDAFEPPPSTGGGASEGDLLQEMPDRPESWDDALERNRKFFAEASKRGVRAQTQG